MRFTRGAGKRLCLTLIAFACITTPALADKTSGTWTGNLELRGNYYWEQSTRVVAPSASFSLDAPSGVNINGHYLVDSITSASQAAGALVDVRFTEIRHDFGLGVGYEFDLGKQQLTLNANAKVSREPDYLSLGGGVGAALALAKRTTTLRLNLGFVHDEIRQNFRTGAGARPDAGGGMSGMDFSESFNAMVLSLGWEQVLSPIITAQVTYNLGYMNGFLANAYRRVPVNGVLAPENHPKIRVRHTATGRISFFSRRSKTAFQFVYRTYLDNWDIAALTPEVRVYQEIGAYAQARVRWRHYRQRRSFFYSEQYTGDDEFVTVDPKMSTFHSNLLGFQFRLKLAFLEDTGLDFLRDAALDINFEYIWNTNRFGNGVISEVGLRIPF